MILEPREIPIALLMGVGATLLMDLWNLLLKRVLGISSLSYCLLGRWVGHMSKGTFTHPSIASAAARPLECATGWIAHYMIGLGLAIGFVLVAPRDWLARPTLLPALLYGVVTVIFPLFVMQPSLGLGVASSRAANPAQARLKSLATHLVFGLGLYACALARATR